jgi:hypothetical protein
MQRLAGAGVAVWRRPQSGLVGGDSVSDLDCLPDVLAWGLTSIRSRARLLFFFTLVTLMGRCGALPPAEDARLSRRMGPRRSVGWDLDHLDPDGR